MSPFQLHWKTWLAPAGVTLVAIWGMYLGAVGLFVSEESDAGAGAQRSTQRGGVLERKRSNTRTDKSLTEDQPEPTSGEQGIATAGSDMQLPSRVEAYRAARRTVALAAAALPDQSQKKTTTKAKTTSRPVLRRSAPAASRASTLSMLREQIMGEAYQLAMHSKEPWQNLIAISQEHFRRGNGPVAREVLLAAEKLAVDPDNAAQTSAAVRDVVKAMLAQRNNDDAVRALVNIHSANERERAMAEVAVWAARHGRLKIARNLSEQLSIAAYRDLALVAIAESQASYEGVSTALRTVEIIKGVKKKNDAYRRIALKRAAVNDFAAAETAVVYINDKKMRDSALGSVARQRARSGDLAGGLETMLSVNDPAVADASLRSLSDELAKLGWFSSSAYVATRIHNNREKSYALERLSVELARSGDVMGSLLKADAIPLDDVRERTLKNVSSVTALRGAPGRARNVAIRINSSRERDQAYRSIANATARNGDYTAAFNTLQEINLPKDKALAMVSLARFRQRDGSDRKALALLEGAGRTAQSLSSARDIDSIRATMAVAYAECSESERSLDLVAKIKDSRHRDQAYRNLAGTLAANRDVYSAQKSVMSISSEHLRRSAGDNVARALARYTSPHQALRSARTLLSGRQRIVFLLEVSRKI